MGRREGGRKGRAFGNTLARYLHRDAPPLRGQNKWLQEDGGTASSLCVDADQAHIVPHPFEQALSGEGEREGGREGGREGREGREGGPI